MDRPAVLIVDDMEVNRDILSFYFRKEYTVLEAADGEAQLIPSKNIQIGLLSFFWIFICRGKVDSMFFRLCKRTIIIYQSLWLPVNRIMSLKSKLLLLVRQILFINLLTLMLFMVSLLSIFNDRKLKE